MSHLGELITAFLDGELTGAERDRVTGHLAGCARCRADTAELRELKNTLAALSGTPSDPAAGLTRRLLAVPDGATHADLPAPADLRTPSAPRPVPSRLRRHGGRPGQPRRPGGIRAPRGGKASTGKRRYVVLGAMSVVVGIGAAAYSVGGSDTGGGTGPRITPPVELYSEEHAITTGEVPFTGQAGVMGSAHATHPPAARPRSAARRRQAGAGKAEDG
jgi:anti-sigma factor RsiW